MPQQFESGGCAEVLERLETWIDGDLEGAEAAAVEEHLADCTACQDEHRVAEQIRAELRALPELDVPARVLRAVDRHTRARALDKLATVLASAVRRPLPVAAAAAAVVLAIVLIAPWEGRHETVYSDAEIYQATQETKLALAYIGNITRRAELRVKERVLDQGVAVKTMRDVSRTFQMIGGMGSGAVKPPVTPYPTVKGS